MGTNEILVVLLIESVAIWGMIFYGQRRITKDIKSMKSVWDKLRLEVRK